MRFSLAVAALIPVLSAYADDHLITVGAGGLLAFSPTNITAKKGDTVSFQFQSKNHTATQSTFANPCQVQTGPQGIDSNFQFVPANATMFPQWSITIDNDTSPLWFFCAQPGHCQKGMVFSINAIPDGPKSFAAFQALAMGQAPPPAAGGSSGSSGASPSPTNGSASPGSPAPTNGGTNNDGTNPSAASSGASGAPTNSASSGGSSPSSTASNGGSGLTSTSSGSTAQQSKKASAMRIGGSSAVSLLAAAGLAAGLLL